MPEQTSPPTGILPTHAFVDGKVGPGCKKVDPIVIADGVTRQFGGNTAVDVQHLEIPRGKITALIGPNGAGKTTMFNLLTGFDKPNTGTWSFDGTSLANVPAFKVARSGMVRTFQLTKSLGRMTVLDNMLLGADEQGGEGMLRALFKPLWRDREKEITEKADELLARFKLDAKREDYAASLSGGQRKLLEMARALMSSPKLIMLDEPMAGVNPALVQSLLGHVKELKNDGTTVLFVEHDMHMVTNISDWVVVMAEGQIVAEGPPETVMKDQAVIDAYLGAHHDQDLGDLDIQELEVERIAEEEGVAAAAEYEAEVLGTTTIAEELADTTPETATETTESDSK
ncbi:ABC transporter ATP-binding protein [Pseudoclavibacter helvolus]|uniref:ABC transporter ATP-binding protein n=1 Tax=Pseudoclavibacter helvolus TaxID=255205 RepID=UPI000838D544